MSSETGPMSSSARGFRSAIPKPLRSPSIRRAIAASALGNAKDWFDLLLLLSRSAMRMPPGGSPSLVSFAAAW
jgi:hypothetical protein